GWAYAAPGIAVVGGNPGWRAGAGGDGEAGGADGAGVGSSNTGTGEPLATALRTSMTCAGAIRASGFGARAEVRAAAAGSGNPPTSTRPAAARVSTAA